MKHRRSQAPSMLLRSALETQRLLKSALLRVSVGDDGQDMIEYALLAALISIVAIGVIILLGPYLQNAFTDIINALNSP